MSKKTNKLPSFPLCREKIFLILAGILLCVNLFLSTQEISKMSQLRKRMPYTFLGDRFRGIESIVGKAPFLGYYTDKNLDDNRSAMQFAQAQLVLAPTILDLNNTRHEFIIFDCTTPQVAMAKIKEINAKPLIANQYGIILVKNLNHADSQKGSIDKKHKKINQQATPVIGLPFIISLLLGYLLVCILLKEETPGLVLRVILGAGLGLGISSQITFYGFLLFNALSPQFTINSQCFLLGGLALYKIFFSPRPKKKMTFQKPNWKIIAAIVSFLLTLILVVKMASFYPNGGWDAWQVWNFKARFLLMAGENWQNLFDPQLWRTSPHYPLLLPLMNVWVWFFTDTPTEVVPMAMSIIFTTLTAGLLSAVLWQRTKSYFSIFPGLLLLTLPFYNLLAVSQYCDIVLSFYVLAAIITLSEAFASKKSYYALLSGLFAGFLGFTKPEGLVAALLILGLAILLCVWGKLKKPNILSTTNLGLFILGLVITSIPTFAFHVLYSPGNQTMINGLTSVDHPATWERLQMIFAFLLNELKSKKWNGLWFLIVLGIIFGGRKLWSGKNLLAGMFFVLYMAVILTYYQINTYFEIKWWVSVTLNRILFSLLPLILFWIFSGILAERKSKS